MDEMQMSMTIKVNFRIIFLMIICEIELLNR